MVVGWQVAWLVPVRNFAGADVDAMNTALESGLRWRTLHPIWYDKRHGAFGRGESLECVPLWMKWSFDSHSEIRVSRVRA